jgi:acyl carrier protein
LNSEAATTEDRVKAVLISYLEPRWEADPSSRIEIKSSTNLTSDLTLDSFQIMEFLMEIEDEIDIAIDMKSLSDVHTVSDLAAVVDRQLQS